VRINQGEYQQKELGGRSMNSSLVFNDIEIALIDLEYAAADFNHINSEAGPQGGDDYEELLSKLIRANRAVQLAIFAFGRRSTNGAEASRPAP
jgi:hypothetical protein